MWLPDTRTYYTINCKQLCLEPRQRPSRVITQEKSHLIIDHLVSIILIKRMQTWDLVQRNFLIQNKKKTCNTIHEFRCSKKMHLSLQFKPLYHAFYVKIANKKIRTYWQQYIFNNNSLINIFACLIFMGISLFRQQHGVVVFVVVNFCFSFSCFGVKYSWTFQMIGASISDLQQTIQGNLYFISPI